MLMDRPVVSGALGAFVIAFSAILVKLAEVSPSTAAFFRCLYALPLLGLLAWHERRRYGQRSARDRRLAWFAGIWFAFDLLSWHHAIAAVGAGLGTVLANVQVVIVGLIAWVFLHERPARSSLVAVPVVLVGVVLISGAIGAGAYGDDPALGVVYGMITGLTYALFLVILRQGNSDVRRPAGPLFDATLVSALATIPIGLVWGNLDWAPDLKAQGYLVLLALSSQALGWLLISITLPRLPAALTSVLLTVQPVLSVLFAWAILSESPSALQLGGVAFVVSGLLIVSAGRRQEPRPEPGYVPAVAEVPD
jgi:drug/metabolite transporter (DMT)-like permease